MSDQKLAGIDRVAMDGLAEFAREAEDLRAQKKAALEMERWLGAGVNSGDIDKIQDGIRQLERWLRDSPQQPRISKSMKILLITAVMVVGFLAAILSIMVFWLWGAAAIPGIVLILWILLPREETDRREVHRGEYLKLGIGEPENWNQEKVE